MKNIYVILMTLLLLTACQESQEAQESKEKEASTERSMAADKPADSTDSVPQDPQHDQSKNEHTGHDHSHGHSHDQKEPMASDEKKPPFREIKPEYACEKPVVIEFYAYQCPHCYDLEPAAEAWIKKNNGKVEFISVPTDLGRKEFGVLLLVHHAANKLGVLNKTRPALFKRVHDEKKLFGSADEAAEFLAAQGADKKEALKVLNDQEAMVAEIKRDFEMMAKYKITHVPQVMVNHQYITDITSAGSPTKVFERVDEMLALENSCK